MDDVVRDHRGPPLRSTHTTSRVLPSRWSSTNVLRGDVELLSLDIFGFALSPAVLDPGDVHLLVQTLMHQETPYDVPDYLERRRQAESFALHDAASQDRQGIALAEVTERLSPLLAEHTGDGAWLAHHAVKAEIDYEQRLHQANPDALTLYHDARRAKIPVAFVADSLLPRDIVTKMLMSGGYHDRAAELVSSHEGVTKASGGLFRTLAERTGVDPRRIVHIGPNLHDDVSAASSAGLRPIQVRPARSDVRPLFELQLAERTGLDSIALALACDRMAEVEDQVTPTDIGYYATGPLLCGFTEWVGRRVDELDPDHVLYCGPAGRLLRELTLTLRPDLEPSRLVDMESPSGEPPSLDKMEQMIATTGMSDRESVLAVDLGWAGSPHQWLPAMLAETGRSVEVTGVYLAIPTQPSGDHPAPGAESHAGAIRTWAFGRGAGCDLGRAASIQFDVFRALIPSSDHGLGRLGQHYRDALPRLRVGAVRFAEDFRQWIRLGDHRCSPALAEPALRIITSPTASEAELLGHFHATNPQGPGTVPLAVLPPLDDIARNPKLLESASRHSTWPEGYEALSRGEAEAQAVARRRRRGLRKGLLTRDQAS